MEFSKQEYWSGCHFLLQGILLTRIKPGSPALQAQSLPSESPRKALLLRPYIKSPQSGLVGISFGLGLVEGGTALQPVSSLFQHKDTQNNIASVYPVKVKIY